MEFYAACAALVLLAFLVVGGLAVSVGWRIAVLMIGGSIALSALLVWAIGVISGVHT